MSATNNCKTDIALYNPNDIAQREQVDSKQLTSNIVNRIVVNPNIVTLKSYLTNLGLDIFYEINGLKNETKSCTYIRKLLLNKDPMPCILIDYIHFYIQRFSQSSMGGFDLVIDLDHYSIVDEKTYKKGINVRQIF